MKKIIGIFVMMLLVITAISAIGISEDNNYLSGLDGELDQFQETSEREKCAFDGPEWYAQSFIPTQSITSRIEIYGKRINSPNSLIVGIKHDLEGKVLSSLSIRPEMIPDTSDWISFDIPDVYTPLGETSYIVVTEEGASSGTSTYIIYGSILNTYEIGSPFYSHDEGKTWDDKTGDLAFRTYVSGMDTPPEKPTIEGPTNGKPRVDLLFKFNAVDPEGDDVRYVIDWGDGTPIETSYPFPSGEDAMIYHKYMWLDSFVINVTAIDCYHAESDWTTLEFTMPRNNIVFNPGLKLFERFPNAFPILRTILGL